MRVAWMTLLVVLLGSTRAGALEPRTPIATYLRFSWTEKDGLPSTFIFAITQDRDGYLWLGTNTGPIRFDGVRFTRLEALGITDFPYGSVSALAAGSDGSLWIGLVAGGISRVRNGAVQHFNEAEDIGGTSYTLLADH